MFRWRLRRQAQKILDQLSGFCHFTRHDLMGLILVLAGEKKACCIDIDAKVNDRIDSFEFEMGVRRLEKLLNDLGLVYFWTNQVGDLHGMGIDFKCASFHIGKSQEAVAPFVGIYNLRGSNYHRTLGCAVDIPVTAVEAWVQGAIIEEDELPRKVRDSDYYKFAVYRLSRSHWREELRVAKRRARVIKSIAPTLYNEIVADL